nr:hypothetical protein [Methylomarinum sp. Ch1-1]MDP4521907.1 hypothetical protein [Methylomarinum sp. Ch1-1]
MLFNMLTGYGALTSFVLCIGHHGHVAVERAGHEHGDDWSFAPKNQTSVFLATTLSTQEKTSPPVHHDSFERHSAGSIEPCLDVPIGQGEQTRDSMLESILQYLIAIGYALYAIVLCLIVSGQSTPSLRARIVETNPISSTPALRRSTVLLI